MSFDPDLDALFQEAMQQADSRRPIKRFSGERPPHCLDHPRFEYNCTKCAELLPGTKWHHLSEAARLAEKALFRRLSSEANAAMDAKRFEFYFSSEGSLSLDQWRAYIDIQMEKTKNRSLAVRDAKGSSSSPGQGHEGLDL